MKQPNGAEGPTNEAAGALSAPTTAGEGLAPQTDAAPATGAQQVPQPVAPTVAELIETHTRARGLPRPIGNNMLEVVSQNANGNVFALDLPGRGAVVVIELPGGGAAALFVQGLIPRPRADGTVAL